MSITVFPVSSLQKVFSGTAPQSDYRPLSLLAGEKGNIQFALTGDCDTRVSLSVQSDAAVHAWLVREIPSRIPVGDGCDDYILQDNRPGMYPDALVPMPEETEIKAGAYYAVWTEVVCEPSQAGRHTVTLRVGDAVAQADFDSIAAVIPEQTLICTHWFHSDCFTTYYKVPFNSEEYWRITENFVRTAVEHGINFLLTPLFTPPLDTAVGGERPTVQLVDVWKEDRDTYRFGFTALNRWIDMALRCGVQYFEMSHLFTQWGAACAPKIMAHTSRGFRKIFGWNTKADGKAYASFLRQFAGALIPYLRQKGVADRCWFHTSDEPNEGQLTSYSKASRLVTELFGDFRRLDALSNYEFYQRGLIDTPVPVESEIEQFRGKVGHLWTYYCCGPRTDNMPNRFFGMPSLRNRILGVLLYLYDVEGFLQWGYNFWHSQYSLRSIDPWEESDAGNAFPSGDAYQVYPAEDGTALPSLRFKVFRDALQDIRVLRKLESLTSRAYTEAVIQDGLAEKLSFSVYPHDEAWLENLHSRVVCEINKAENA